MRKASEILTLDPEIEDRGWLNELEARDPADHGDKRTAQARQRRQNFIANILKNVIPRYLRRKLQESFLENSNAKRKDFSTLIIQREVSFQVSSNFLSDEEQAGAQVATLARELKNL